MTILKKNVIIALIVFIVSVGSLNCYANGITGYTTKSDIVTYINNYPIQSFNINGYTAIVAEDLKFYGFDVVYDYETRILQIKSNQMLQIHSVADTGKTANGVEIVRYQYNLGTKLYDIYATDIKTYLDGKLIESFNINGYTAIYANELASYGSISYNDSERNLYITLSDKNSRSSLYDVKKEIVFNLDMAISYLKDYWNKNNMYVFSLNLTGNESIKSDYKGKYYELRCKSWLSDEHLFKVYESGYVVY